MKTTLFMLMSFDGKISTGEFSNRDFDKDLPMIPGATEGLAQYYQLEEQTDLCSFNTGKVLAKVGWNEPKENIDPIPVTFVVVDSRPHLTQLGVENLLQRCASVILVTANTNHPAMQIKNDKLHIITLNADTDFKHLFEKLEKEYGIADITIQSGGDMNALLLRLGLIDELSVVVAPVLVGGHDTPSLIGGESLKSTEDLQAIKSLELLGVTTLKHNYLHIRYKVR